MLSKLRKSNKGFTIIEVLIVLAIAGLILLIVFLAVPALQRNQRNTARKGDVARLGGAATEFVSNNNGTLPTAGTAAAGCPGASDPSKIYCSAGTLAQYTATNFKVVTTAGGVNGPVAAISNVQLAVDSLSVGAKGAQCGAGGATVAGNSARQMAIQYAVETSNGKTTLCQDI